MDAQGWVRDIVTVLMELSFLINLGSRRQGDILIGSRTVCDKRMFSFWKDWIWGSYQRTWVRQGILSIVGFWRICWNPGWNLSDRCKLGKGMGLCLCAHVHLCACMSNTYFLSPKKFDREIIWDLAYCKKGSFGKSLKVTKRDLYSQTMRVLS